MDIKTKFNVGQKVVTLNPPLPIPDQLDYTVGARREIDRIKVAVTTGDDGKNEVEIMYFFFQDTGMWREDWLATTNGQAAKQADELNAKMNAQPEAEPASEAEVAAKAAQEAEAESAIKTEAESAMRTEAEEK